MASTGDHSPARPHEQTRLDSWKAIAVYLNREINAVQRWERNEGLPVHRHVHGKGGSIYAYADEIDEWRRTRSSATERRPGGAEPLPGPEGSGSPIGSNGDARAAAIDGHESTQASSGTSPDLPLAAMPRRPRMGRLGWVAVLTVLAVAAGAAAWWGLGRRTPTSSPGGIGSIAVLPLRDLSPQAGEEYFADSMTEMLIARLATTTSLKVTSRTSVMAFKERSVTLPEIARSLGVDAILEGSVTHVGDRLRIIATLVDADADAQLWSGKFERPFEDVLALQAETADAIARAVQATVQAAAPLEPTSRQVSSVAYRHYLKGRFLLSNNTRASIEEAIAEFNAAIAADPGFAPAHAGLAAAYEDLSNRNIGVKIGADWNARSIASARRALELNPNLAEAHAALGRALMAQLRWEEAEVAFRRALALNPSDVASLLWFSQWSILRGHADDGIAAARRAMSLDPLSVRTMTVAAFALGMAGARDEQAAHLRAALALRPDYFQAHFLLGLNLSGSPDTRAEALTYLERAVDLSDRAPQIVAGLASVYMTTGRTREARELSAEVIRRRDEESASPLAVGRAYLLLGDREMALQALEKGLRERSRGIHQLPKTNWFRELEDDSRYQDLLRRVLAG